MVVRLRRVSSRIRLGLGLGIRLGLGLVLGTGALASAGLVLATASGCRLHTEAAPVAEQARAPELELPAHDGRTVSLGQLLARGPAVLVFYRGHW